MRNILDAIFSNKKASIFFPIGTVILTYLAFVIFGTAENKIELMLKASVVAVACFVGVFYIFYIQIKNPICPEWFLNLLTLLAALVFATYGTITCVAFAAGGFENFHIGTCLGYVAYSAIALAHSKRTK